MGLSQIAANKSKKSEDILPQVESYFRQLSDRIRSRQVNLSAVDIQIDVAVDAGKMSKLEQLKQEEFRGSVVYSTMRFRGIPLDGCLMFQYGLLCRLYEISLGGPIESIESQPTVRSLTPIIQNYVNGILDELIVDMNETWPSQGNRSKGIEMNTDTPSLISPTWGGKEEEMDVFVAVFDFGSSNSKYGLMSIFLPVALFERALGVRASRNSSSDENLLEQRDENVSDLPVTLIAELERICLSLEQIQSIEVGDFIPLSQNFESKIWVNKIAKFSGVFGSDSGMRAIQITSKIN